MKYNYRRNRRLYIKPFAPSFTNDINKSKEINQIINTQENNIDTYNMNDLHEVTMLGDNNSKNCEDNTIISIFGFDLELDDIIIIALVIFLIFEKKIDYLLIIVLALMLFDISIDTFKNLDIFKKISGYF